MNKEQLESMLIDYIDGKLNSVDKHMIEQELLRNAATFKLYEELKTVIQAMAQSSLMEPTPKLQSSFSDMLAQEIRQTPKKTVLFTPVFYRVAAAIAFIVISAGMVYMINEYKNQQAELARIQAEHQKLLAMIGDSYSPAQRLLGVKAAYSKAGVDGEIIAVLIKTMNEDPNSNVRLAAIEGLNKFNHDPGVRSALISSILKQTDPVVQITLIQVAIELNDKAALEPLQQVVKKEEVLPSVKDEAYLGIMKLS